MSHIPTELKYTSTHEWLRTEEDGSITVGITDHAQELLGDIVFVELPQISEIGEGDEVGVIESVKAASDIYSPVNGEIIEINEELNDAPELINSDPYGDGWIFRLQPYDEAPSQELLDADAYEEVIESE